MLLTFTIFKRKFDRIVCKILLVNLWKEKTNSIEIIDVWCNKHFGEHEEINNRVKVIHSFTSYSLKISILNFLTQISFVYKK